MKALEEIKEIFLAATGWEDRYNYLVELSYRLPVMPEHLRIPENRVECTSTIYFSVQIDADHLRVHAYANAAIPAGLAALLVDTLDNIAIDDVLPTLEVLNAFFINSELIDNLTPPRRSAILSMLARAASAIDFI